MKTETVKIETIQFDPANVKRWETLTGKKATRG